MWIGAVNVLISGGFTGAYEQLLPEFERTSGIKVTTRSGASQGVGPQTIAAQLARGVSADVVILSREGLGELMAETESSPERTWTLREYPSAWPCGRGLQSPT
jgi:molybdate transport system substrate-binding protein